MKSLKGLYLLLILFMGSCGEDESFTNQFTDERDGSVYRAMTIDDDTWMQDNLRYKGGGIGWAYNNDPKLEQQYGRMYGWDMLTDICPKGWKLPTKAELEKLSTAINSDNNLSDFLVAGGLRQNEEEPEQYVGLTEFQMIDLAGFYWSASEIDEIKAHFLYFDAETKETAVNPINKEVAICVRCIKE